VTATIRPAARDGNSAGRPIPERAAGGLRPRNAGIRGFRRDTKMCGA